MLAASYVFYINLGAEHALILFTVTLVTYIFAQIMGAIISKRTKHILLIIGLCANLSILIIFKYLNFITRSLFELCLFFKIPIAMPVTAIILPIGISFFTFRAVNYLVDIYQGKLNPERNFGHFALYVSFFPSLLAGPIDRATTFLPQTKKQRYFNSTLILNGLQLIMWGIFKKVVIADRLALYVNSVYGNLDQHTGPTLIIAAYFYTIQIYCDFSGYSDIAIGCGRMLGYELMQNFNLPYFATTMSDFWRRWHISLSTWFRDYVYIPLGGNRQGKMRILLNLLITMVLCGFWHGAAWNFIVWGGLHGILLCFSRITKDFRDQVYQKLKVPESLITVIRTIITFHLVAILWIFFRIEKINDALYIIKHIFIGWPKVFVDQTSFPYGLIFIPMLLIIEFLEKRRLFLQGILLWPIAARWAVYWFIIFTIILFGVDGGSQFIYFQF